MKDVVVISGPNGAGKTTAAFELLPKAFGVREFVNADEIARGISPLNPEGPATAIAAARLMIGRIRALAKAGQSFGFETTCAGRGHIRLLRDCRTAGYRVFFLFLWLPSPDTAIARVAHRVRQGGHNIPRQDIIRRYAVGLRNMWHLYLPLADTALVYDNSDDARILIAERRFDASLIVHDEARWLKIERAAR